MSRFLSQIIDRHQGRFESIRPRPKARYEVDRDSKASEINSIELTQQLETSRLPHTSSEMAEAAMPSHRPTSTTEKSPDLDTPRLIPQKAPLEEANPKLKTGFPAKKLPQAASNPLTAGKPALSFPDKPEGFRSEPVETPLLEPLRRPVGDPTPKIFSSLPTMSDKKADRKQEPFPSLPAEQGQSPQTSTGPKKAEQESIQNMDFLSQIPANLQANQADSPLSEARLKPAENRSIKVHIGRIEIKAVKPDTNKPKKRKAKIQAARSLEEILKQRDTKSS